MLCIMIERYQIMADVIPIPFTMSNAWDSLYPLLGMLFLIWFSTSMSSLKFSKRFFRGSCIVQTNIRAVDLLGFVCACQSG